MKYTPIIGLEIHVELATKSKMFCRCSAAQFGLEPNTNTCPVCLGLPGALPYPNRKAIEYCVMIGQALNCKINHYSNFDRKNYFYPDLPKGFQISQYPLPFGEHGYLDIVVAGKKKRVRITRVHMEEDTGKSTHTEIDGKKVSLLDFNRSGVPLVEIVTEPDIHSGEEAKVFLTELQKIIRYLGVSDADMEKGNMRLEPNISLHKNQESEAKDQVNENAALSSPKGEDEGEGKTSKINDNSGDPESVRLDSLQASSGRQISLDINIDKLPPYKVEVKNINSFRFVEKAINFEIDRHAKMLDAGENPKQETRGWNENRNETVSQRSKEEAHDYRYFPEPDIPPILMTDEAIANIADQIPELPIAKTDRYTKEYELPYYDAEILTRERALADYFEEACRVGKTVHVTPKQIANMIINKKVETDETEPAKLVEMIIESTKVVEIDINELATVIDAAVAENPKLVADYKAGKIQVIGFFIGQVKRKFPQADATVIKSAVEEKLKEG